MRAESTAGDPSVQDASEVADLGWFEPDDLPAPLFLSLANLIAGRTLPRIAGPFVPSHSETEP